MGSGISGLYADTYGAIAVAEKQIFKRNNDALGSSAADRQSQPYAESYGVTEDMLAFDKERGVYTEVGYRKNPTAVIASTSVRNGILVNEDGSPMDGHYTYAVTTSGDLVIGRRNGNGRDGLATPHPTLIGGKDPKVKVAGIATLSQGKITKYDNESGHFKPNILSMTAADEAFSKLPDSVFHCNFKKNMRRS